MQINQEKAWEHLTKKEQMSLSLTIVSERSKKEASIIMNLAPYKFTEIYLRARKLFVLFSQYYEENDSLLPPGTIVSDDFKAFVSLLVKNRLTPSQVLEQPEFLELAQNKVRLRKWTELMSSLGFIGRLDTIELLREFDRWNNFRILPKKYRLPAAFPRRRNRVLKNIWTNLNAISDYGWDILEQTYGTTHPPMTYMPIVRERGFTAIAIDQREGVLDYMERNKIPVFNKKEDAELLAELMFDYNHLKKRSTYSARKFWANYRTQFKKAQNYEQLMGLQGIPEEVISQNDKAFLKSTKRPKARVRGQSPELSFYG